MPNTLPTLSINNYYNFAVYANTVIGTSFNSAKLISIMDYYTAIKFSNIELTQKQVSPYLPPGTLTDNKKYTYYLFTTNNSTVVVADAWIIPNSVVQSESNTYTLTLNNVSSIQLNIIRDQLRLLGIAFQIV